ncbi:MAG: Histidine kinase, partial [Candidatus Hydrogenedentes bacterium]|nr:Histidine kinase [Candidatus Hydrogenedentota bacterium]
MANNIDIVKEFLVESYEGLNRVDNDLLALELDPDNREKLASVFRAIHTIKGSCSFLEFPKLESLAHAGESLLALLRDGKKTLSIDIITVLLTMVDAIREILGRIEATMQEGEAAYPNLIGELRRHCEGESGGKTGLSVSMAAVAGREHAAAESGSGDSLSPDRVLASSVAGRSSSGPGADTPNPRDGLMQDFLAETRANMAQLEADLVLFERGGVNEEKLDGTYRIVHTLRGSSQLVGLAGLAEVAGAGEDLMKRLRSGQIPMDPESIGALHLFADAVRRLVEHFAQSGVEDAAGSGGIVEMLHSVHREPERAPAGAIAGGAPSADREMVCSFLDHAEECLIAIDRILEEISCSGPDESSAEKALHEMGRLNRLAGCMEYEELEDVTRAIVKKMERFDRDGELLDDSTRDALGGVVVEARRILASIGKAVGLAEKSQQAPVSEKNEAPRVSSAPTEKTFVKRETIQDVPVAEMSSRPSRSSGVSDSTIRVDVRLLDELMNLVGELVLARNQLMQRTTGADDSGLAHCTQRLNYLTSELQEHVMKTRMQPVGNVWSKFPRVVRDLAINCGKRVRLEMHGGETELDKTLIEAINDPLIHLVRNCVDHGIGLPQERIEAGKPEEGSLVLRAYHESGQVNIEVSDDGRGIDLQRLRQKAVERNLISAERARTMNDREAMNLIFLPGLTTAEEVTNVSGR